MNTESIYYRRKWIMYKPADQYDGSRVVESPVLVTIWPDFHPTKESWDKTVKAFYRGKLIDWSESWEEINVNPDIDLEDKEIKLSRKKFWRRIYGLAESNNNPKFSPAEFWAIGDMLDSELFED